MLFIDATMNITVICCVYLYGKNVYEIFLISDIITDM